MASLALDVVVAIVVPHRRRPYRRREGRPRRRRGEEQGRARHLLRGPLGLHEVEEGLQGHLLLGRRRRRRRHFRRRRAIVPDYEFYWVILLIRVGI